MRFCISVRYAICMSAIHHPAAVATLRLKTEQVTKYRRLAGLDTDKKLAERMQYDAGNLSRVLAGKQTPGPKFIAAIVAAFPGMELDDLFEVVETGAAA